MNEIFIVEGERSNYNGTTRKVLGVYSSLERGHKTIQDYFVSTLDNIDDTRYQNYVVAEHFLNDALARPSQPIVTFEADYKNVELLKL
jgi:hypothetical protein